MKILSVIEPSLAKNQELDASLLYRLALQSFRGAHRCPGKTFGLLLGLRAAARANPGEAEAIGDWLCRRRQEFEEYYHKALEKLVAILTPYSAQREAGRELWLSWPLKS